MDKQDIVENLRTRARNRREIPRAKEGEIDRIADTCEEAANEIESLRKELSELRYIQRWFV